MNTISVRLEEERKEEQRHKLISGLVTFLIIGGIFAILTLFGFTYLDPPPPEQGVVVAIEAIEEGNSGGGSGSPSESSASSSSSSEENTETQDYEETEESAPSNPAPKPTVNPDFQFNPTDNDNNNNDNNSNNSTKGEGDLLANGIGNGVTAYIGNGRGVTNTIKPTCDFKENGTVVVKIKVNRDGKVISAEPVYRYKRKNITLASTANDKTNFDCARQNAYKITFKPNPDAPEVQEGAVTFEFKLR